MELKLTGKGSVTQGIPEEIFVATNMPWWILFRNFSSKYLL
jgi:hypothetical protein